MLRKTVVRAVVLVVGLYLAMGAALYVFQEKLVFHPSVLPASYAFQLSLPFEEHVIEAGEDRLDAVLVHAARAKGVLVHFHGNAGTLEGWTSVADDLARRLGWDVLVFDYPGFGKSGGVIRSEAQLHADADAVLAAARGWSGGKPVAVMGRSIGTGFAVRLAARNEVAALVLEAPFYSLRDIAALQYPWFPVTLFLRYPLDSYLWMPQVHAPTLVLHGTDDQLIPFSQGERLAALNPRARLAPIPGGTHNDLRHHPEYWRFLEGFFAGLAPSAEPQGKKPRRK
jgi:pimeloyl-ACP methyl ester carboxylesterase